MTKYTKKDLTIEYYNGIITISIINNDIYHKKRYIDYTRKEAIEKFLLEINS